MFHTPVNSSFLAKEKHQEEGAFITILAFSTEMLLGILLTRDIKKAVPAFEGNPIRRKVS